MTFVVPLGLSFMALFRLRTKWLWLLVCIGVASLIVTYQPQWWGLFHYQIGAKYFQEVGYFDLYNCSTLARGMTAMPRRDLYTYEFTTEFPMCDNFTPERWQQFTQDLTGDDVYNATMIRDKGLNATPTWIVLGERLSYLPTDILVLLDPLFLGVALLIAGWLLDWRKVAYATLFIITFYGTLTRLTGHFGQWWWLCLVIIAISLIQRQKAIGGLFLGLATSLAIFPLFLLIGRSKRILAWSVVGMAIGLFIGLTTSRGFQAYPEFLENILLHSQHIRYEPFNIGLFNTLSMAASPQATLDSWLTCFRGGQCAVDYHFVAPVLLWLVMLPLVLNSRVGAMFGLITLSRYYYLILAVLPLQDDLTQIRRLFALSTLLISWSVINRGSAYHWSHLLWIGYFASYWIPVLRQQWESLWTPPIIGGLFGKEVTYET